MLVLVFCCMLVVVAVVAVLRGMLNVRAPCSLCASGCSSERLIVCSHGDFDVVLILLVYFAVLDSSGGSCISWREDL